MAIQILQNQYPTLGYEVGQGFGEGLKALAQNKLHEVQWKKALPALNRLGFNNEQAEQLRYLPAEIRQQIILNKIEEPSRLAFEKALRPEVAESAKADGSEGLEGSSLAENLNKLGGQPPSDQDRQKSRIVSTQPDDSFLKKGLSAQQALQLSQLQAQQKLAQTKEHASRFKETAEVRQKILDEARAAKDQIRDLGRLEELEQEGKLDTPGYVEFLKRSGLDIPALTNPGSEEFNKVAATFLRDAKTFFGSRISNFEVENFLKTLPSLSQSPEGRKRVIANLKNIANAKLAYADTLKEIMKENKGVPPLDISEQIYDRIDARLDKLAERFKKDLEKPVPRGQNKFITALQAATGSLIGAPGNVLKATVPNLVSEALI